MRVEQEHAVKLIHVLDVQPGDLIEVDGEWLEVHAVGSAQIRSDGVDIFLNDADDSYVQVDVNKPIIVQRRFNRG